MYTVKRIIDGDVSGFESANWTIGRNGLKPGKTFQDAVAYSRTPTPMDPCDLPATGVLTLGDVKSAAMERLDTGGIEVQGESNTLSASTAYEISGVTVIPGGGRNDEDLVLVGAVPGTREVTEALGVVVTTRINEDQMHEVQYDFVYPGMQVYITDRFGNTVESLR
jgi:hypothetical protein